MDMGEAKKVGAALFWMLVVISALIGPFLYLAWQWIYVNWIRY